VEGFFFWQQHGTSTTLMSSGQGPVGSAHLRSLQITFPVYAVEENGQLVQASVTEGPAVIVGEAAVV